MSNKPQGSRHKARIPFLRLILISVVGGGFTYAYAMAYSPSSGLAWVGIILLGLGSILAFMLSYRLRRVSR